MSVGVFYGDWVEAEGEGLDTLDEPLREWVVTSGIELGESHQEVTPDESMPDILCGTATLNGQPPQEAHVYADIVGNLVDPPADERLSDRVRGLRVQGAAGRALHRAGQGLFPGRRSRPRHRHARTADAVALRYPGVADIDGEGHRAVFCAVECAGRRHDRVVALKFGPDGKPCAAQVLHQDRGPVGPEGCWLGVQPKNADVTFFLLGSTGTVSPEG